jgi:hypothetical protein
MLKCKYEHCQYPNCNGENCGVPVENMLALMCAEANYWRQTVQQMYNTAIAVPVGKVERELRRFLPQEYTPTCPFGYTDCISDPAYIREYHPKWWIELGRPTECSCHYSQPEADAMGGCPYYDDEDK